MGMEISVIVDTLYPIAANKRGEALTQMLTVNSELRKKLITEAQILQNPPKLLAPSGNSGCSGEPGDPGALKCGFGAIKLSDCTIHEEDLQSWSKDPSAFWNSSAVNLNPQNHDLASFYTGAEKLDRTHAHNGVIRRFVRLFFLDILQLMYPRNTTRLSKKASNYLSHLISKGSSHDQESIRSNLTLWLKAGRRYDKLAKDFGEGVIIVLPVDTSHWLLENKLPLDNDEKYKEFTQPLVDLKIKDYVCTISANKAASKIRTTVLNEFRFIVQKFYQWSSQPEQSNQNPTSVEPNIRNRIPNNQPTRGSTVDAFEFPQNSQIPTPMESCLRTQIQSNQPNNRPTRDSTVEAFGFAQSCQIPTPVESCLRTQIQSNQPNNDIPFGNDSAMDWTLDSQETVNRTQYFDSSGAFLPHQNYRDVLNSTDETGLAYYVNARPAPPLYLNAQPALPLNTGETDYYLLAQPAPPLSTGATDYYLNAQPAQPLSTGETDYYLNAQPAPLRHNQLRYLNDYTTSSYDTDALYLTPNTCQYFPGSTQETTA